MTATRLIPRDPLDTGSRSGHPRISRGGPGMPRARPFPDAVQIIARAGVRLLMACPPGEVVDRADADVGRVHRDEAGRGRRVRRAAVDAEFSVDVEVPHCPARRELQGGNADLIDLLPVVSGARADGVLGVYRLRLADRNSTRLNSSHLGISYAVFC